MNILVTGGAGFIGANLCRELLARPSVRRVTVLDDLSTGKLDNVDKLPVDIIKESVLNRDLMNELIRDHDGVVHLAALPSVPQSIEDPVRSHEVNTNGTLYVLEACRAYGRALVFASSSAVYGPAERLPISEDSAARPQTPYAAHKLAAESYALAYSASYQIPVAAFRFFNVYGPMQSPSHAYAAVVPSFIDAALAGRPLRIHGDGAQTRDFTYVGSLAKVLADAAINRVSSSTPVNLAFGTRTTVLGLARQIEEIIGCPVELEFTPGRAGDIRESQASCERLRALLPDRSDCTLDEGLRETVNWFRSYHIPTQQRVQIAEGAKLKVDV